MQGKRLDRPLRPEPLEDRSQGRGVAVQGVWETGDQEDRAMRVYVASSWRNTLQPLVVKALRGRGHDVYDFRNPRPGDHGFQWSGVDPHWQEWSLEAFRRALSHSVAESGFRSDMCALQECQVCVLVLPCGRSAHLELGWAVGAGKETVILLAPGEPELMYKMVSCVATTVDEVARFLERGHDWL
jgi:hypothetical protein